MYTQDERFNMAMDNSSGFPLFSSFKIPRLFQYIFYIFSWPFPK